MHLRHLTLACLLACLSGCFSIGVVSKEFTVTSIESDTEIVLRSFETKPVMHDLLGFNPVVWPIELVYDLVLPWYALFSDELDLRWGPGGADHFNTPAHAVIYWPPGRSGRGERPWDTPVPGLLTGPAECARAGSPDGPADRPSCRYR